MKKLKAITAAFLACATMLSFTSCAGFKVIDDEDVFFDALDNAVGIDDDETFNQKNTTYNGDKVEYVIYAQDGDNFYTYIRFKKADDAMDLFDDFYQDFKEIREDGDFEGSHSSSATKTRGSVVFNGEIESGSAISFFRHDKYLYEDTEVYGGVYVNDNVYIEVYSMNGSKRDKEKITNFLKEIGFPKP